MMEMISEYVCIYSLEKLEQCNEINTIFLFKILLIHENVNCTNVIRTLDIIKNDINKY